MANDDDGVTKLEINPWGGQQRILPPRSFKGGASTISTHVPALPPASPKRRSLPPPRVARRIAQGTPPEPAVQLQTAAAEPMAAPPAIASPIESRTAPPAIASPTESRTAPPEPSGDLAVGSIPRTAPAVARLANRAARVAALRRTSGSIVPVRTAHPASTAQPEPTAAPAVAPHRFPAHGQGHAPSWLRKAARPPTKRRTVALAGGALAIIITLTIVMLTRREDPRVRERARIGTSLSSTLTTEPDVSPINSTAEPAPLPPTLTPTISEPAETRSADEEPARAERRR